MILGTGQTLSLAEVSWLFDDIQPDPLSSGEEGIQSGQSSLGGVSLKDLEQQAIMETLKQTEGNQTRAARVLGISDRTLRGKIKQYKERGQMQLI